MLPSRSPAVLACLAGLALLGPVVAGAAAPASPEAAAFRTAAAAECTAILNQRDATAFLTARGAALDLLYRAVTNQGPPPADEVPGILAALDAGILMLDAARDRLAGIAAPDGPDAAAWVEILAGGAAAAEPYRTRRDALAAETWDAARIRASVVVVSPGFEEALSQLGFERRDCAVVFSAAGVVPGHTGFLAAAASACAAIVERRLAGGYDTASATVLAGVTRSFRGEPVASDNLVAAVAAMLAEWRATEADFARVPVDDVTDAAEWQLMLQAARDRIAGFELRAEALASGDTARITAAFARGVAFRVVGGADLASLGLEDRDCRALTF
ncbi:MAG: hypothetical protein KIS96_00240 [Bauldia sp.]|nr:hypothetical protein [Bauldia sp.]